MSEVSEQIGQMIRETRKMRGLTQKELGKLIGVGEPTVNKYESGKQNLTVETLKRIADALNIRMNVTFHK